MDGLNWYVYCYNNPIFYVDGLGLDPVPAWAIRLAQDRGTMEDYLEALRVDRSGTAGSWQGSASYTVTLAIAKVRGTYIYNWTGEHVTDEFKAKVYEVANKLGVWPEDLMAVMAFESWLDPSTVNSIGATGLIQFMPSTAASLGTSTYALSQMSAVEQMDYVYKYLSQFGSLYTLEDIYMAILWPAAVGQSNDYVLWWGGSVEYNQNNGLDVNGDGKITKEEAAQKVKERQESYGKA